ncbi:MAG: hypothetical protein IJS45_01610 [Clostridia bacterium]|nr:hypothetical protein [Clostridia bacterium]
MKGILKFSSIILFVLTSLAVFSVSCRAEDYIEKYKKYIEENGEEGKKMTVTEFLTGEKLSDREGYEQEIEGFFDSLPEDLRGSLGGADGLYEAAEKYDLEYFTHLLLEKLKEAISSAASPAAVLSALIVIAFLSRSVSSDMSSGGAVSYAVNAAFCVFAISSGIISFSSLSKYFEVLSSLAGAAVPACIALLISSGRVGASSVSAIQISTVSAIVEKILSGVCIPLLASSCALMFAESLSEKSGMLSISKVFRSAAIWIAVSVTTVASFIFGIQSTLSNAADTVGLKTLKFALGSAVPLVGGALGDTVSAITAGASSVKGFFGVAILVAVFISLLSPLAPLITGKISICISRLVSGALGCGDKLLSELSSTLNAMIALVVSGAAVFSVVIVSFISFGSAL